MTADLLVDDASLRALELALRAGTSVLLWANAPERTDALEHLLARVPGLPSLREHPFLASATARDLDALSSLTQSAAPVVLGVGREVPRDLSVLCSAFDHLLVLDAFRTNHTLASAPHLRVRFFEFSAGEGLVPASLWHHLSADFDARSLEVAEALLPTFTGSYEELRALAHEL
jgi:hypothetical protein